MKPGEKGWRLNVGDNLSVAMETNGRGFMGFIVELPGAFVRGPGENEALAKVPIEAQSYIRWLGSEEHASFNSQVVQRHSCSLMVEDGDCEILLDSDKGFVSESEWRQLTEMAKYSGETFCELFDSAKLKDWVDEARIRKTFYGNNKKTIQEIFDHVKRTQYYYLSRTSQRLFENEEESLMMIRKDCFQILNQLFGQHNNSRLFRLDNEDWTLKKIMRRFIWHDRIHGKAIVRILEKQKRVGLVGHYRDPFQFSL